MAGRVEPFRLSVIPNSRKAKKQIAVRRIKVVLLFEFDISHCLDKNRVWYTKPCSTITMLEGDYLPVLRVATSKMTAAARTAPLAMY